MIIERAAKKIIFRLPYSANVDNLQDLTDLPEYKEIVKKSKTIQKDVDNLVATIKKGCWRRTKRQLDA